MSITKVNIKFLNQILSRNRKVGTAHIPFLELKQFIAYTRREDNEDKYYQRAINNDKIESIKTFFLEQLNRKVNKQLHSTALGIFPTSTLIAINESETSDEAEYLKELEDLNVSNDKLTVLGQYFTVRESIVDTELLIPHGKTALIVDGQHRLYGLTRLYHDVCEIISKKTQENPKNIINLFYSKKLNRKKLEYDNLLTPEYVKGEIEKFEFLCTLLMNFDIFDQSRVFADVNFNQKSVNKSLFYDIFGTYPDVDNNEIVLAHEITELFFNDEDSVFGGNIKMLGSGPGLFSQSFFVEALLRFFKIESIWGEDALEYLDINKKHSLLLASNAIEENKVLINDLKREKTKIESHIYNFINNYFSRALVKWSDLVPDHKDRANKEGKVTRSFLNKNGGSRYDHVLLKTVGIGAFMRYIEIVYPRIYSKRVEEQTLIIDKLFDAIHSKNDKMFSNKGNYKGGSGFGTRNRMFQEMVLYTVKDLYELKKFSVSEIKVLRAIADDDSFKVELREKLSMIIKD